MIDMEISRQLSDLIVEFRLSKKRLSNKEMQLGGRAVHTVNPAVSHQMNYK